MYVKIIQKRKFTRSLKILKLQHAVNQMVTFKQKSLEENGLFSMREWPVLDERMAYSLHENGLFSRREFMLHQICKTISKTHIMASIWQMVFHDKI